MFGLVIFILIFALPFIFIFQYLLSMNGPDSEYHINTRKAESFV